MSNMKVFINLTFAAAICLLLADMCINHTVAFNVIAAGTLLLNMKV